MKKWLKLLYNYKITILLCIFYTLLSHYFWDGFSLGSLINAFTNSLLILLLFIIFGKLLNKKNIIIKILGCVLILLSFIILTTDIVFIFKFKSPIRSAVFASIMETNTTEVKSMMTDYWIIVIFLFLLVSAINYLSIRELMKTKLKISYTIVFFIICLILIPFSRIMINSNMFNSKNDYFLEVKKNFRSQNIKFYSNLISYTYPVLCNDLFIIIDYISDINKYKKFNNTEKTLPKGVFFSSKDSLETKSDVPDKIYLIIGESSYRKHYSLYDYGYKTTPFLDSLKINNQDSIFNNFKAISTACLTRDVIRMSLTFSTPHNYNSLYTEKSIIDLANDKGYETVWLSNQEKGDIDDGYISLIASSSNIKKFFINDLVNNKPDDLNLAKELRNFYKENKKQFIILHLRGSHGNYKDGYDDQDIMNYENSLTKEYDRTIHHTDRVLRLINSFIKDSGKNSILFYFSDHGELINLGHGVNIKGIQQYEIPIITINYNNNTNLNKIISKYINPEINFINNSSTINIIAEIMGYYINNDYINLTRGEGQFIINPNNEVMQFKEIKPLNGAIE